MDISSTDFTDFSNFKVTDIQTIQDIVDVLERNRTVKPITRLKYLQRRSRYRLKKHFCKVNYQDKIMSEIYNGWIKFNIVLDIKNIRYPTSVTLKKNIVALWLVMMDKVHTDHNRIIIDFIQNVCMKRWRGDTAKGMSDFIIKCMIHSMLEKDDYEAFKMVYISLNGRMKNHTKIVNPPRGKNHIKISVVPEDTLPKRTVKRNIKRKIKRNNP